MQLKGKKIALGISGGIAAYKCAHLVRVLVKDGAEVRVVMTPSAADFVTPKTLAVLSGHEVWADFFDPAHNWRNHVELGEWADLMLVAPLTANTLAKMSAGSCDNLLLAVYLSCRGGRMIAPAMDLEMYRHPAVVKNLGILKEQGVIVVPAEKGFLASGLEGEGRMAEPERILEQVRGFFNKALPLQGKKVLINAGPTYEPIDPVRFIGNRSSGKMGVALAEAFYAAGAGVTLVLGPSAEKVPQGVTVIRVESAAEMREHTVGNFTGVHLAICSAAVADYRPAKAETKKIKKTAEKFDLELVKTPDILAELGTLKKKNQVLVGFALETDDLEKYAVTKLKSKKLDVVIANLAREGGGGIGSDHNSVTIIDKNNKIAKFELKSKTALAADIVAFLSPLIHE